MNCSDICNGFKLLGIDACMGCAGNSQQKEEPMSEIEVMKTTKTHHLPTIYNMCNGCVREYLSPEWIQGVGVVEFKVCKAYAEPTNTPWARQNKPCPAYSSGKEST